MQMRYVKQLFAPRRWLTLVPDHDHATVTAGYESEVTYATAARAIDGHLIIVYLPTNRPITVDMSKLRSAARARWYDPTNGAYTTISASPLANRGARQFSPPITNSGGDGDWVLTLEATR